MDKVPPLLAHEHLSLKVMKIALGNYVAVQQ
jgi:hypothetical protein